MSENDLKKHIAALQNPFVGNISSHSHFGNFSNYATLIIKKIKMIIGSTKEDLSLKKKVAKI